MNDSELQELYRSHTARNALFLTRGRHYIRAIGSDETPVVTDLLAQLLPRFEASMEGISEAAKERFYSENFAAMMRL